MFRLCFDNLDEFSLISQSGINLIQLICSHDSLSGLSTPLLFCNTVANMLWEVEYAYDIKFVDQQKTLYCLYNVITVKL